MLEKEILKKVSDALAEKPVIITIKRQPKGSFEKWLAKNPKILSLFNLVGLFMLKKEIITNALTLGTLYRISALVNQLEVSQLKATQLNEWLFETIEANAKTLSQILAAAIHNQKKEVPESLVDWLFNNLTARDYAGAMQALKESIDISNFTNTIVSVRSVSILSPEETSQADTREKIALGRESGPQ